MRLKVCFVRKYLSKAVTKTSSNVARRCSSIFDIDFEKVFAHLVRVQVIRNQFHATGLFCIPPEEKSESMKASLKYIQSW